MSADKKEASTDLRNKKWRTRFLYASLKIQKSLTADKKGFNYKYCPIQKLLVDAQSILGQHFLYFSQRTVYIAVTNRNVIETEIYDALTNECVIKSSIAIPDPKYDESVTTKKLNDKYGHEANIVKTTYDTPSQSIGASLTYLRRYALFCILGIQPEEEDTDGKGSFN